MGARAWDRAYSKRYACVQASLARLCMAPLDEHRRTVVGVGRDYVGTGALGAAIDDVPLAVRERSAEI